MAVIHVFLCKFHIRATCIDMNKGKLYDTVKLHFLSQ